MNLEYIPFLRTQRELQGLPRNYDRFREYLRTMQNAYGDDGMLVPLLAANPMARDHVTVLLDALLAIDADRIGAAAAAEAAASASDRPMSGPGLWSRTICRAAGRAATITNTSSASPGAVRRT